MDSQRCQFEDRKQYHGIKYFEKAVRFVPGDDVQDSFFQPYSGVEYKEYEIESEGQDEGQTEILKGLFGN